MTIRHFGLEDMHRVMLTHEGTNPLPKHIHRNGENRDQASLQPRDLVVGVRYTRVLYPLRHKRTRSVREKTAKHDSEHARLDTDIAVGVQQVGQSY